MFSFFLASIFEIGKLILRLGVQRVSGGHISSCGTCMFGVAQACAAPKNNAKSLHWSSKDHSGRLWAMVRTKITRTRTCHNLEYDPESLTHVELPTLKSTFRFQISMLERNQTYERTQNSKALRYAGLRFYSIPIFDNERFDALQYPCDSSSRKICALDSSAQDRTMRFL